MQLAFQSVTGFLTPETLGLSFSNGIAPHTHDPSALQFNNDAELSGHDIWRFLRNASALSTAMIAQAFMDLASPESALNVSDEGAATPDEIRQNALYWFSNPESGEFSLKLCCTLISLFLSRRGFSGGLESDFGTPEPLQPGPILEMVQRSDPAFLLSLARTLLTGIRPNASVGDSLTDFPLSGPFGIDLHSPEGRLSAWASLNDFVHEEGPGNELEPA